MAKPYCFNQPIQTGPINFRTPGQSAFIPLTSHAVQVYGHVETGTTLKITILAEQLVELFREKIPHVELAVIVIVPCVLASGDIVYWAKKAGNNNAFQSWVEAMQESSGIPQVYSYDEPTYCFIFKDAPLADITLPSLTQEDVIASIDSISINDPDSDEFAEFVKLFD